MSKNGFGRRWEDLMELRLRLTRKRVLLAGVVAALLVVGVGYAAIPDVNSVYTACMLKSVGTLRLIDPSLPPTNLMSHCSSLETQITWNQKGQAGLPGAAGAAGPPGPAG